MLIDRRIYILVILLIFGWVYIYAQKDKANIIDVNVKRFIQEKDSFRVDIDFDLESLNLSSREQLSNLKYLLSHSCVFA